MLSSNIFLLYLCLNTLNGEIREIAVGETITGRVFMEEISANFPFECSLNEVTILGNKVNTK